MALVSVWESPWMPKTFWHLVSEAIGHGFPVDTSQSKVVQLELK